MSPCNCNLSWSFFSVPRASGDEPKSVDTVFDKPECSPRERG